MRVRIMNLRSMLIISLWELGQCKWKEISCRNLWPKLLMMKSLELNCKEKLEESKMKKRMIMSKLKSLRLWILIYIIWRTCIILTSIKMNITRIQRNKKTKNKLFLLREIKIWHNIFWTTIFRKDKFYQWLAGKIKNK